MGRWFRLNKIFYKRLGFKKKYRIESREKLTHLGINLKSKNLTGQIKLLQ